MLWDTPVAVKELRSVDEDTKYLTIQKEITMLSELRHPNCVLLLGGTHIFSFIRFFWGIIHSKIHCAFSGYTPPPNAAIVVEYMDCGSLWDILHNAKLRLENKQIFRVAKLTARGHFLHFRFNIFRCYSWSNISLPIPSSCLYPFLILGLLYLHQHDPPIYHRDIKSQNVLISGDITGKWHSVKVRTLRVGMEKD
jgi:serine/threonine protein kinase